jgi:hypothetical protein
MKHIHTFESFLNEDRNNVNEGDMTNMYDGFIASSTDNKISYKFRYQKGMQSNKAENAAFEKMMKETGKPRGSFWVTKLIPKGEFDKDVTPVLESNTNEAQNLDYWKDYEVDTSMGGVPKWMSDKCTDMSSVLKCIDKTIAEWNKEADTPSDKVSKADEKWIGNLAIEFYKKFGYVNGNIVGAMISQESK